MLPSSLSARDRLRRTKSTRSIRRTRQPSFSSEPFDPDLARSQAMAAATQAMRRSNNRSSMDYRRSYDRLGGPENVAVPSRRRLTETASPMDEPSPNLSMACYMENQDTYPAALPPINEFGGLDGRMASQPSSYRKLRKAKSMFSTRQRAAPVPYGGISSEQYSSPVASQEGSADNARPHGTLRRSMSFLKGGSQRTRSIRHAKSQDVAIQLARTQFAQGRKPSLTTLRPRKEQKPFRKSFRNPSESITETGGTPVSERSKNGGAIHGKARSLSSSIKKGLKRVLGLSKPAEEQSQAPESPVVQNQWNYAHSSTPSSANQDYVPDSDYSYFNSPEERFVSPARPPTLRSSRSSESLATSRSRVTSWADSTVPNTVTTKRAGDMNSLSIIDENGTPGGRSRAGSPRPNTSIEGQRLYSALMKHIGRTQAEVPDEQIVLGRVKEHRPIPERTSSLRKCRSKQTIRQIPSDESLHSRLSYATANGGAITPQRLRPRQPKCHVQHGSRYSQNKEVDRPDDTSSVRRQPLGSLYEAGEDSDGAGSVIVDRSKNVDADSPSIYSRTTSGDSPTRNDQAAGRIVEAKEEPGMAMVYESQRTVYRSPKRAARSGSTATVQPSADWQKWMNSQIARIEHTPTREHYREDAQIHDDDETDEINALTRGMGSGSDTVKRFNPTISLSDTGEFSINMNAPATNNFSRPFSRSSSVRSTTKSQNQYAADHRDLECGSSLSLRTSSRHQTPESPTPKRNTTESPQQRMATRQYRRYQTSRMPMGRDAKSVPFRSIRDQRGYGPVTDENHSPISSKKMVDSFLDSRRRPIEMEMPGDDGTGAFI
ncbi:uncharacterized protein ACHE_21312S [Aspergillus chevalieri]|uniref:Uncharacterized protein n=1 Tax=Aspergillus chevalieri TaxID=182096 RepID=A0A7R7VL31_ASPCH|nr:uncharacterized protein ACHE_21312S [Aspergillus chevalieri]BCR85854.1 hypothetical protein ACHE_21312S [Aspergillus chevalieri]